MQIGKTEVIAGDRRLSRERPAKGTRRRRGTVPDNGANSGRQWEVILGTAANPASVSGPISSAVTESNADFLERKKRKRKVFMKT